MHNISLSISKILCVYLFYLTFITIRNTVVLFENIIQDEFFKNIQFKTNGKSQIKKKIVSMHVIYLLKLTPNGTFE